MGEPRDGVYPPLLQVDLRDGEVVDESVVVVVRGRGEDADETERHGSREEEQQRHRRPPPGANPSGGDPPEKARHPWPPERGQASEEGDDHPDLQPSQQSQAEHEVGQQPQPQADGEGNLLGQAGRADTKPRQHARADAEADPQDERPNCE